MASNLSELKDFIVRELAPTIQTNAYGQSRYLSLATPAGAGLEPKRFTSLEEPTAGIVSVRGGAKPVSDAPTVALDLDPVEFAVIVPFHKDLMKMPVNDVAAQLAVLTAGSIARAVDLTIRTGEDARGVDAPVNFGTFKDLVAQPITTRASFIQAIKSTVKNGRSADGMVISSSLWLDIQSFTTDLGVPIFNVVGDHINGGTINGIRVRVYESAVSEGIIGALTSGAKGGFADGLSVDTLTEATLPYGSGTLNLATQNHYALRVSGNAFYNYFDEDNFVKISAA